MGWNGVAYRYRALVEYDEEFTESISVSVSPPGEERYWQERAYFGFFTSALSVFECYFYSAYCIGSILEPNVFRMSQANHLRRYPKDVSKRYSAVFTNDPLSDRMASLILHDKFTEIDDRRNVLSHRGSIRRAFGLSATMPRNVTELPDQWDQGVSIDVNTTASLRQWISDELEGLVDAAALFCKAKL